MRITLILILSMLSLTSIAKSNWVNIHLTKFDQDGYQYMNTLPEKMRSQSKNLSSKGYTWDQVLKKIVPEKQKQRDACVVQRSNSPGKPPNQSENIQLFFKSPEKIIHSLEQMERKGLRRAQLKESPWSGDYWPIASGILGRRYKDPDFLTRMSWKDRLEYIDEDFFWKIFDTKNSEKLNILSPAEKWDILIGNSSSSFLANNWLDGKPYYEKDGYVEEWMGICHGWAAASFMTPRPERTIQVLAFDGETQLKIQPSELKGLVSYLWAKHPFRTRFLGQRCNDKEPKLDESGRLVNEKCEDSNPGVWHKVVVNQIGRMQKSFIIDASYDYEVWNHPVYSYEYWYFNPKNKEHVKSLDLAKVKISDFKNDKFKKYRSKNAHSVVGVAMEMTYVIETPPNEKDLDTPLDDRFTKVRYLYDLELDQEGRIIGGEWYNNFHPDFLWKPDEEANPQSPHEALIHSRWERGHPIPDEWQEIGRLSADSGFLLSRVIHWMVEWSRHANDVELTPETRK